MSRWIKKGDKVCVITGNDKGRTGQVLGFRNGKVLVQGINVRKKHVKRTQENQSAQILDIECPIEKSNVVLCGPDGSPISLTVKLGSNGSKELVYLQGGKQVVFRKIR